MTESEINSYFNTAIIGLNKYSHLTSEATEDLRTIAKAIPLKKGQEIIRLGDTIWGIYFMVKGLGKSFYYKGNTEITSWIIQEGEPFGNYKSYCTQVPSRESTTILEEGFAFYLPRIQLTELCQKHICICNFIISLNEQNFMKMDDHHFSHLFKTAEERYIEFNTEYPNIFNRMKLKDIASYLNMSPETLSRIRNKSNKRGPISLVSNN